MAPPLDPYRTLGLTRTATPAEVKQAYRRLAKANHPDAAGEAALPRFLAIQAAYDQIMGPGAAGNGAGASAPRRPWSADPDRTDATHRAYGGRARRTRTSGPRRADPRRGPAPGGGPATGAAGTTGSGATGTGASDSGARGEGTPGTGAGGPSDETGAPRGGSRRTRNKATLGSTSYDGAEAEPFEPDWGGASWYGTTSGTYWTLNPKEYADPRKHGPEYQARARRAAAEGREMPPDPVIDIPATPIDDEPPVDPPTGGPDAGAGKSDAGTPGTAGSTGAPSTPPPTHTTASWWDATAGPAGEATGEAAAEPRPATGDPRPATAASGARPTAGATATAAPADAESPSGIGSMAAASAAGWAWLDDAHPRLPARIARAIIGWIPIALAIGWLGGELSGCARFAADCDPSSSAATWLFQAAALAVLLLLPALATPAAIAAIAAVVVAVPAALILAAPGTEGPSTEATTALGVLLAIAWVGGLGVGVGRSVRGMSKRLS